MGGQAGVINQAAQGLNQATPQQPQYGQQPTTNQSPFGAAGSALSRLSSGLNLGNNQQNGNMGSMSTGNSMPNQGMGGGVNAALAGPVNMGGLGNMSGAQVTTAQNMMGNSDVPNNAIAMGFMPSQPAMPQGLNPAFLAMTPDQRVAQMNSMGATADSFLANPSTMPAGMGQMTNNVNQQDPISLFMQQQMQPNQMMGRAAPAPRMNTQPKFGQQNTFNRFRDNERDDDNRGQKTSGMSRQQRMARALRGD